MSQRVERLSSEIRRILGDIISRQEIKDPRVSAAGLITFTHVRVTGDLQQARVQFMVHGASEAALAKAQEGLTRASGYIRRVVGQELNVRIIPSFEFVIDRVFEQEDKVDALLRDIANEPDKKS